MSRRRELLALRSEQGTTYLYQRFEESAEQQPHTDDKE